MGTISVNLVWILVQICIFNVLGNPPPPKLEVTELGKSWTKVEPNPGFGKTVKAVYFGEKGDDLFLRCKAGYPIRWNVSGVIAPPEIVKFQQPKRDLENNLWIIKLNVFFVDAENFSGLLASSLVGCEKVGDWGLREEVGVFVRGGGSDLFGGDVPCASTDPRGNPPQLWKVGGDKVENVRWNPVQGFKGGLEGGRYKCRRGKEEVTFEVAEEKFSPGSRQVTRWKDEWIEFRCGGDKTVKLIVEMGNGTEVKVLKEEDKLKVKRLRVNGEGIWRGRAVCLEGDEVVNEWLWEFVEPPEMYLDNLEGEVDCLSELTEKFVETVRCRDESECGFMEGMCWDGGDGCGWKKQKVFRAEMDTRCWVEEEGKGRDCVSLPFSHLNGAVRCGLRGRDKRWTFFVGLDYKRYRNWKEAPRKALVRLEELEEEEGNGGGWVCTAAAFIFADSLAFEVEYKNGSKERYYPEGIFGGDKRARQILELYVSAVMDYGRVGKDAVKVSCLAPVWNGTEVVKMDRWLGGEGRRMKGIGNEVDGPLRLGMREVELKEERFFIGSRNKRLNCSEEDLEGIWWFREGEGGKVRLVEEVFPEVIRGENWLEFEYVEKKFDGEYECVEKGMEGGTLRKYKLQVAAEPMPVSTTVYVGITILALVIVGLAIAAFTVFIQKRNI